jgi:hypothetical protein
LDSPGCTLPRITTTFGPLPKVSTGILSPESDRIKTFSGASKFFYFK